MDSIARTPFILLLSVLSAHAVDQLSIWTFPTLSGVVSGSAVNATTEILTGTPTATLRNSDIYASGQTGVTYTDIAGVSQPANKAFGWSDFKKSAQVVDGQLDLAFNASGRSGLGLRFDCKHSKDNDASQNQMEWLYSTNGGSSWSGATLFTVTDNNAWASKSFTLPTALDGQSNVIVRLQKYAGDSNATEVNNVLIFDNIELTGGGSSSGGGVGGGGGGSQSPFLSVSSFSAGVPTTNPVALCGAIGDTADAARTAISISPADADTLDASLTATASSNSPSVATASLTRTSAAGQDAFALTLNPLAVGYATITVTIADPEGHSATYTVNYAVSAASSTASASRRVITPATAARIQTSPLHERRLSKSPESTVNAGYGEVVTSELPDRRFLADHLLPICLLMQRNRLTIEDGDRCKFS